MGKILLENFHAYCKILDEPEERQPEEEKSDPIAEVFNCYEEMRSVYGKKGDQIFHQFLNKVYDSSENQIMNQLPLYLNEMISRKVLNKKEATAGVT